MAEGLVIQELQSEFGSSIVREFPIHWNGRRLILDGLFNAGGEWFVVEIKFVRRASALAKILSQFESQSVNYLEALDGKVIGSIRFILAIVVDQPLAKNYAEQVLQKYASRLGNEVSVRLFEFANLAEKYGVSR